MASVASGAWRGGRYRITTIGVIAAVSSIASIVTIAHALIAPPPVPIHVAGWRGW